MVGEQTYQTFVLAYLILHIIFSAPRCFGVEFLGKTIRGACLGSGKVVCDPPPFPINTEAYPNGARSCFYPMACDTQGPALECGLCVTISGKSLFELLGPNAPCTDDS